MWDKQRFLNRARVLTHLPLCRIHASVNWIIIGLDYGLSPGRRQAII